MGGLLNLSKAKAQSFSRLLQFEPAVHFPRAPIIHCSRVDEKPLDLISFCIQNKQSKSVPLTMHKLFAL